MWRPQLYLKVPLHVVPDWLDRATGILGELLENDMFIIAAQIVEEHRHIVDDFALPVAKVVRGTDLVACHVIVVVLLAPVCVLTIEQTVGAAADAADNRVKVAVR